MENRKPILFRIALATAGLTEAQYARKIGVNKASLHRCVRGEMTSARLSLLIDRFIARQLHNLHKHTEVREAVIEAVASTKYAPQLSELRLLLQGRAV